MEAAAALAFGLRDWVDAGVIVGILLLNAIVGWYQEKQISGLVEFIYWPSIRLTSLITQQTLLRL